MTRIMERPKSVRSFEHIPVLLEEVAAFFEFPGDAVLLDGTLGLGGHAERLLRRYPRLRVIGLDLDASAVATARDRLAVFGERFIAVEANFAEAPEVLKQRDIPQVNGVLLDLGVSSRQLETGERGFSFMRAGPLDMRMSLNFRRTAWDIVVDSDEDELAEIFHLWGEEPSARRAARALKEALRKGVLTNETLAVAQCLRNALGAHRGGIDPATRCFQGLRIAVNRELENLRRFLDRLQEVLLPGGRVAVLAYHSLEDRMVKQAFRAAAKGCVCPPQTPICVCGKRPWARLTRHKAIQASESEMEANPRARSVRLRTLEKL